MRVLIVEDQTMLRESLASAINAQPDMEVVGHLGDAAEVESELSCKQPDLLLMDVCTENDSSGIVAARKAKAVDPHVKVVIMTGMSDVTFVKQAREAGVESFVYKNIGTEELLSVLRSTAKGYNTFPGKPAGNAGADLLESLTDEEIAILKKACESKSKKEIAAELYISEGTLKRRTNEILAKTGYDSILKLAVHAVSTGLIVPNLSDD